MKEPSGNGAFSWIKGAILLLLLVCLGILVLRLIPAEWLEQDYLDSRLQQAGALAPLVFVLVKALVVLTIVPVAPLDVAAGALFGPLEGSIYSIIGSEAGAIACFYLARYLGRDAISRLMKRDIVFCDRCAEKHLAILIFFARLEPMISFALVSYGAGLTNISFSAYAISTFLGMAPITIALNYYGKSFLSGNMVLQIVLGLVLVILMFLVPIWIKRRNPWGLYEKMKGEKERGD